MTLPTEGTANSQTHRCKSNTAAAQRRLEEDSALVIHDEKEF